mmetsp:Transcript_25593/g.29395  ORF Transcript_25593/g.29395 Transcript_25593/m.29395 type:complete len:157 (+) Transcript_25593:564-1034(+)
MLYKKISQTDLTIKDSEDFYSKVDSLFQKLKDTEIVGFIPSNNPLLMNVDPSRFAVSICTVDGQIYNFGDVDEYVCMHQLSSVVSYLSVLEEHGQELVSAYIGTEPNGKLFDSLELMNGIPHNPLISSGALMSCSLFHNKRKSILTLPHENFLKAC